MRTELPPKKPGKVVHLVPSQILTAKERRKEIGHLLQRTGSVVLGSGHGSQS